MLDELCNAIIRLFRDISADDVLSCRVKYDDLKTDMLENLYFKAEREADEAEISRRIQHLADQVGLELHEKKNQSMEGAKLNVYDLAELFADEVLVKENEEVVCRFEHLQTWRRVTNKVDGELFVAAKYALIDYRNGKRRSTFIWKNMIGHNNVQLNKILAKGISDNHFHLLASAPYFNLTWMTLMNQVYQPELWKRMDQIDRNRRTLRVSRGTERPDARLEVMHIQAVLIRLYLYAELTNRYIKVGEYYASWGWLLRYIFSRENVAEFCGKNLEQHLSLKESLGELQKSCPRFFWLFTQKLPTDLQERICEEADQGADLYVLLERGVKGCGKIPLEECGWIFQEEDEAYYGREWKRQTQEAVVSILRSPELLMKRGDLQKIIDGFLNSGNYRNKDYVMNAAGGWYERDQSRAVMNGERWLIYSMFRERYNQKTFLEEIHYRLFYAYLTIKERFRMELLQSNDRNGFLNFKEYQKRKTWFTTEYTLGDFARIAVDTALEDQNMRSLEIRIKPEDSCGEDADTIIRYDKAVKKDKANFYYVFHFSKKADDTMERKKEFSYMFYRHYALREEIRKQAEAIILMRKRNPKAAQRVMGIDACSNEDGCRPEVFATAYRVLRNHSCYRGLSLEPELPQLRMTYHVGEVFQDIADGLRAVDEAIHFLNMDCGDRLGHATVLGMDVREWYQENNYRINIRQQDYLDNVVWLYQKLIRYRITGMETLLEHLKAEFQMYFSLIFEKALEEKYIEQIIRAACKYDKEYGNISGNEMLPYEFNINIYYYSWMLRGDHPKLYQEGFYKRNFNIKSLWEDYSINHIYPKEKRVRYILPAVILNHYYHYDPGIKSLGSKAIQIKIPENMVEGIRIVQKEMQKEIAEREIAIETNPSSNLMINRIRSYDKHPIVQFYNKGLTFDHEKLMDCAQLNVSINTDDQGVFATSLSNEYALMASALGQVKDANGNHVYRKADIYEWIEAVQKMGNRQSFLSDV